MICQGIVLPVKPKGSIPVSSQRTNSEDIIVVSMKFFLRRNSVSNNAWALITNMSTLYPVSLPEKYLPFGRNSISINMLASPPPTTLGHQKAFNAVDKPVQNNSGGSKTISVRKIKFNESKDISPSLHCGLLIEATQVSKASLSRSKIKISCFLPFLVALSDACFSPVVKAC